MREFECAIDISRAFTELGIQQDDLVFLHGDAGVASQYREIPPPVRLNHLLNNIINFFGPDGTLVIPDFTYSFTRDIDFSVEDTPSSIGQFSETFRIHNKSIRSKNPLFSVSSIGKFQEIFQSSSSETCFGKNSAFDLLKKHNARIVCLGCDFNRITFTHFLEESYGVPYRYHKTFSGTVIDKEITYAQSTDYFVRDLNIDSFCNLSYLKNSLSKNGLLHETDIGRFRIYSVSAVDFYEVGINLLNKNIYSLIQEGIKFNGI
jgi:aminoglycoside 3-N-acetyltransferase